MIYQHQDLLKRPLKAIKVQILWLSLFSLKQKLIKLTLQ